MMMGDDPFADFDSDLAGGSTTDTPAEATSGGDNGATGGQSSSGSMGDSGGGRSFAQEIYSEKIDAKFRKFFVDVKQSSNGKFVKIAERSRGGQKSTIMMDAEDVPQMIAALQNAEKHL